MNRIELNFLAMILIIFDAKNEASAHTQPHQEPGNHPNFTLLSIAPANTK